MLPPQIPGKTIYIEIPAQNSEQTICVTVQNRDFTKCFVQN